MAVLATGNIVLQARPKDESIRATAVAWPAQVKLLLQQRDLPRASGLSRTADLAALPM